MDKKKGACRFCGQYVILSDEDLKDIESQEEVDELATKKCSCSDARAYQKLIKRKTKAKEKVEALFKQEQPGEGYEGLSAVELLQMCIDLLFDNQISKVKMDMPDCIKATLSINAEGKVTIERSHTRKQKVTE